MEQEKLITLQHVCLTQNIPFAHYRLPLQKRINCLIQLTPPKKLDSLAGIAKENGFIIAPFSESESSHSYLLQPDMLMQDTSITDAHIQRLQNTTFTSKNTAAKTFSSTTKEDFTEQVESIKKAISTGNHHKIVLSRIQLESKEADFDASLLFLDLCEAYPHAFVYFVNLPEVGCWMGASPEPLVEIADELVKTVSLAGTQIANNQALNEVRWSEKEIEEQGIVTSYIERKLQALQIENYKLKGPNSFQAANLIHLKSSFEFPAKDLANRLGEFLESIHPTPSVGGLPKNEARDFLLQAEKHTREYYAGFLGPINMDAESHLFVNLRCLQITDSNLILYSGAGITAASVAEKEWEETENKLNTLLRIIKNK